MKQQRGQVDSPTFLEQKVVKVGPLLPTIAPRHWCRGSTIQTSVGILYFRHSLRMLTFLSQHSHGRLRRGRWIGQSLSNIEW